MSISLSIVIPVLNEASRVDAALDRLQPLRDLGAELILADGGSQDDTVSKAAGRVDQLVRSQPGRACQMHAGALAANGGVLLFLHCDTRLPQSALQEILAEAGNGACWGWFDTELDGQATVFRIISWFMRRRSRLTSVCTGDQGMWVIRSAYFDSGGFPLQPLMEDIALSKVLRARSSPTVIRERAVTSSRKWESEGVIRTVLLMWQLRLQYFLGANPARLADRYYPQWRQLASGHSREGNCRYPAACIGVFAREPVAGQVKSRLSPCLDENQRLALYRVLYRRTVQSVLADYLAPWGLWVTNNLHNKDFLTYCNKENIWLQSGADLGERMYHAASQLLSRPGCESVVLVGTDCPVLESAYLEKALQSLSGGADLVLGPAEDGGYVLIGLSRVDPRLFQGIEWGGPTVLEDTLARAKSLGYETTLLPELWDVDRCEDLEHLREKRPELLANIGA